MEDEDELIRALDEKEHVPWDDEDLSAFDNNEDAFGGVDNDETFGAPMDGKNLQIHMVAQIIFRRNRSKLCFREIIITNKRKFWTIFDNQQDGRIAG